MNRIQLNQQISIENNQQQGNKHEASTLKLCIEGMLSTFQTAFPLIRLNGSDPP